MKETRGESKPDKRNRLLITVYMKETDLMVSEDKLRMELKCAKPATEMNTDEKRDYIFKLCTANRIKQMRQALNNTISALCLVG